MRDPARIERILGLLREVWTKPGNEDMRLAQLVVNLMHERPREHVSQIYNFEDADLEAALRCFLSIGWSAPQPPCKTCGWSLGDSLCRACGRTTAAP